MGKTTRFHPVSLPILRESARAGGIRLGRIHQDILSDDRQTAVYTVEIMVVPIEFGGALPQQIQSMLNGCYSTDVWVDRVWITKSKKIYAEVYTTVNVHNANKPVEYWLTPEKEWNDHIGKAEAKEAESDQESDWLLDGFGPTGEEI